MKKLDNLTISNFKSIKHLEINDFNRFNLFIGYPNAGKSNILEAISLLDLPKNAFNLHDYVRFKDFSDLFYEGNSYSESFGVLLKDFYLNGVHNENELQLIKAEIAEINEDRDGKKP